jgi:maltooligosyltrehalose trehalohydrolase
LKWEKRKEGKHRVLLDFYKNLINLRRCIPALSKIDKNSLDVSGLEKARIVFMRRWKDSSHVFSIFNFNSSEVNIKISPPEVGWRRILDSSEEIWGGPGTSLPEILNFGDEICIKGLSLVVYEK